MRHTSMLRCWTGIVVLAAIALSTTPLAQPGRRLNLPLNRSVVTVVRIKPEMLDEWRDVEKTGVVPALKRQGVRTRTVYAAGPFGPAFEYTIVQPLAKFADF